MNMTTKKTLGFLALLISVSFMGESQGFGKKAAEAPAGAQSEAFDPGPGHQAPKSASKKSKKECFNDCDAKKTSLRSSSKKETTDTVQRCKIGCPKS
jgi:hypothetical protein